MVYRQTVGALAASLSLSNAFAGMAVLTVGMAFVPTKAEAARCTMTALGTYECAMVATTQTYNSNVLGSCSGMPVTRSVTYQVPEGAPPAGGWPVAFYYHGTNVAGPTPAPGPVTFGPADPANDSPGARHLAATLHELLDDPNGTGKRYAVVMPQSALQLLVARFWDSNLPGNYNASSDACFFPALFGSISNGQYGTGNQFNMNRRYGFGMSSGGYNTSRMAVSWNEGNVWRALAIHSASYATCMGVNCTIPATMPANHPATKFYHGSGDTVVPVSTMYAYNDRLQAQGFITSVQVNSGGHNLSADMVGPTGIKAWFDQF